MLNQAVLRAMIIIVAAMLFTNSSIADTVEVHPGDSIQNALSGGGSGPRTVLVHPGVYEENIVFPGERDRYLVSIGGPGVTTIRGVATEESSVDIVRLNPDATQELAGFTIEQGDPLATMYGVRFGGGFNSEGANTISDCIFDGFWNAAVWISGVNQQITIERCEFVNSAYSTCIIVNNLEDTRDTNPLIVRSCQFVGNLAGYGPALRAYRSCVQMENCLLRDNLAREIAGAIDLDSQSCLDLINCTVVNNGVIAGYGGAIFADQSLVEITNSIVQDNFDYFGSDALSQIAATSPNLITVNHSVVADGWPTGVGNIAGPAQFVDPLGPDEIAGTDDDDYRLAASSPCIDAGSTAGVPPGLDCDLAGEPRVRGVAVDMGAFEFQPSPCPGDLNCDLTVTFDDLNAVLASWGTDNAAGDATDDGFVDFSDLNLVLLNWQSTCD